MSTARLTTYEAIILDQAGLRKSVGSLDAAEGVSDFEYLSHTINQRSIVAGGSAGLFLASTDTRFQFLAFRIIGAGTLICSVMHDKPTSSTDFTPLGTQKRWHHEQWTCKLGWRRWSTDLTVGLDSAANEYADNAGTPALWSTYLATMATKKIYAVSLYNASDDTVDIESILVLTQ